MAKTAEKKKKYSVYSDGKLAFSDNDWGTAKAAADSLAKLGRSVWFGKTGTIIPANVAS